MNELSTGACFLMRGGGVLLEGKMTSIKFKNSGNVSVAVLAVTLLFSLGVAGLVSFNDYAQKTKDNLLAALVTPGSSSYSGYKIETLVDGGFKLIIYHFAFLL